MLTVTISLPQPLKTFVDTQVATQGHGDVSAYIQSLLREAQAWEMTEDAGLETLLLRGLASEAIPLDMAFWNELQRDADSILAKLNTPG